MSQPDPTAAPAAAGPSWRRDVLWVAAVAGAYFATARLSLSLVIQPGGIAAIWPPEGIFLSALLLTRRRVRPVLAGVLFLTDFVAEGLTGTAPLVSALYALALTGSALLSVALLGRFVGEPITFRKIRDVGGFLFFAVVLSNGLMSLLAAAASRLIPGASFWEAWKWWATADGVGNLLVTPCILSWASFFRTSRGGWSSARRLESAGLIVPLVALNLIAFSQVELGSRYASYLGYVDFPFLLWAALRFRVRGVTVVLLLLAALSLRLSFSYPMFGGAIHPSQLEAVLAAQLYLASLAIPSLFVAAVVTERQAGRDALRQSEAQSRALFEQAAVGVALVDFHTGRFRQVNQRLCRLIGSTPDAMREKTYADITLPADWAGFRAKLRALGAGTLREFSLEQRFGREDGSSLWLDVTVSPQWAPGEPPDCWVAVVQDISRHKLAEAARHESEEEFRNVFEFSPVGKSITRLDGSIKVNQAFCVIVGYTEEELRTKTWQEITHPDDVAASNTVIQSLLEDRIARAQFEKRYLHRSGKPIWTEVNTVVLRDQERRPLYFLTAITDITQRKQVEAAARLAQLETVRLLAEAEQTGEALLSVVEDQRRTDAALHDSESRFRRVVVDSPFPILLHAEDGAIIEISASWCEITGYAREELATIADWTERAYGERRARVQADIDRLYGLEQRRDEGDYLIRTKGGATRIWDFSSAPLGRLPDGRRLVISMASDVTERRRIEIELRERTQQLQLALQATGVGVWQWALQANRITTIHGGGPMSGLPPETYPATGEAFYALIHPDDRPRVTATLQRVLDHGEPYQAEFRVIRPDGVERWVSAQGLCSVDAAGRPLTLIGVDLDITERKHAEEQVRAAQVATARLLAEAEGSRQVLLSVVEDQKRTELALRASEEQFVQFMRHLPVLAFLKNHERRIVYLNERYTMVYGAEAADWVGRRSDEIWPGELGEQIRAEDEKVLATREVLTVLQQMPTAQGPRFFRTIKFLIPRPAQPPLLGGVALDVTEVQQAEQRMRQLNGELEQRVRDRTAEIEAANQELEAFSYSVSHDLRAPLRGIDGWSLALEEDYRDRLDDQARVYLGRVRAEAQRMGQLIEDLLQLSRVARAEFRRSPVDLSAQVYSVVARLQEERRDRAIEFVIEPGLRVAGDPALLDILLTNLLDNACKFTARRERARVEVGRLEDRQPPVFYVRDNGAGFDLAYADKLFGAFQRMHKASEYPGTGVGLATVQRIVHRHGGQIWAEAAVDQGATFFFTLGELS